jgi:hypothetical protein
LYNFVLVCFSFLGIVQRKRLQVRDELIAQGMSKEEAREKAYPRIHGLVFDTSTGLLKSLPVDFARRVGSLDHIYGLYSTRPGHEKIEKSDKK